MKNKIKFILLFLYAISVFGQNGKVNLLIETNRNAVIILDGKVVYGKNLSVSVNQGIHIVKIKDDLRLWDLGTIIDTLEIESAVNEIRKEYFLSEYVFLQTVPDDAVVYAGQNMIGHTPLFLPKNLSEVKLLKNNFIDTKVRLNKNKIFLNLENTETQSENGRFIEDVWFKVLLGGIVGLGATSAYFKLKADKYYDEYLKTNDKALLNKTNDYDLISGIALGALQINFGILIYHFLIE